MPAVMTHVMTDIRGYFRMLNEFGEAEAVKRLRVYERLVRERLPTKSVEVDHVADGFHLVFRAPREAVLTAIGIADALTTHNGRHPDSRIPVGFGIDSGESVHRATAHSSGGSASSAYTGSAPVIALTLARHAGGGQVLLTSTVRALLAATTSTRDLGVWTPQGVPAIHIFEARAADTSDAAADRSERFLAALLFTDMVQSTATAVAMGDRGWHAHVEQHHSIVRAELDRTGGTEIDTAGDGFYASFDAPSRAIECALRMRDRLRAVGIDIRASIHVGECEVIAGKIGGVAVAVGARVKDHAADGEVLVSRTVRDLVIGTGFGFEERGAKTLKGVPGEWEVYAVTGSA